MYIYKHMYTCNLIAEAGGMIIPAIADMFNIYPYVFIYINICIHVISSLKPGV
jgi:hypothetical protein